MILVLASLLVMGASANILSGKNRSVRFDKWGTFTIGIQPQIDNQPYILTLNVKCDKEPKVIKQLLSKKVCEYRGYSEDQENKILVLHYSVYNDISDGRLEAYCDQHLGYMVDIKLECDRP